MKDKIVASLGFIGISKDILIDLIEVPADKERGDYALPCFALSKNLKKNPVEIAKDIAIKVKLPRDLEKAQAVGPYVNFFVDKKMIAKSTLVKVSKEGNKYGSIKGKDKIMIEFSQPNTHKAFHVGHIRGTSFGESLARIAEFSGNKVIRANYSGDTGMHIAKWLWCYLKFHKNEKPDKNESWFASIYVEAVKKLDGNDEGQAEVEEINRNLDARDKKLEKIWNETRKFSINSWKKIYKELDTHFDVHFFESEVEEKGKKIAKDLIDKGIAKVSEGATIIDLKEQGLSVWVLLRSDGTVLYSAKDLALAEEKFKKFNITRSITITSTEQDLHFQQLIKTLEMMNFKHAAKYEHLSYETIRLPTGKMSSRTGDNILYSEFIEELTNEAKQEIKSREKISGKHLEERALAIAIASIKYSMLKQDRNKVIVFDKKEAMRFEGDSGPYLLYTYARARSVLKKAKYKSGKFETKSLEESEANLVKELARFPEVAKHAYDELAPNAVAHYAYSLAKTFNEFYHATKIIGAENEAFRLELTNASSQVLKNALHLLGIRVIERM